MWLCLMLGLTAFSSMPVFSSILSRASENSDWKSKTENPETFKQTVRAEETNRYSGVARKVIDLLNAGDYAAVQNLYDSQMSQAFPLQKESEFFTDLAARFGSIETFDGPTGNGYQGWIAFRLHCQHGQLTMSLSLDADDRISGIYFEPVPQPALNFNSFVLDFFSWQHLLWLVPFILAGLLYAWLLQKTTERTVGISTLGIHLHQGQNLILWDEIKVVRTLRILNIRSLWLIRESGEKTIMPWTSLERRPDLQAAVEGFAPAGHPLRQYLSLLRRT
jgi:hypothetical protein